MKHIIASCFVAAAIAVSATAADFPIHRKLPPATVLKPHVTIVESRAYLVPVTVNSLVSTPPTPVESKWVGAEEITSDHWTDFTLRVGLTGRHLYVGVDSQAAQISFAEIVFANGDSQVIDCDDQEVQPGLYSLIDVTNGRKVDHIRVVARADTQTSNITLQLAP